MACTHWKETILGFPVLCPADLYLYLLCNFICCLRQGGESLHSASLPASQSSGSAFTWLESYSHQRTQAVCYNGETTSLVSVAHGVPQGSVLGLLLFPLYTSDIPRITYVHGCPCQCYADDTLIKSPEHHTKNYILTTSCLTKHDQTTEIKKVQCAVLCVCASSIMCNAVNLWSWVILERWSDW